MSPISPLLSCLRSFFAGRECEWLGGLRQERGGGGGGLGAVKSFGGGKAVTGTGVLPQTNVGDASQQDAQAACPGSYQEPGCSHHQGCAWCTKRWAAPCCRHEPCPVGLPLLC